MNRKTALALVIAAAASSAFADDPTIVDEHFVSSLSRADVIAEMQQFQQSGSNPWADDYNPLAQVRSDRTREEVTAEYLRSRDTVSAFTGEDSGSVYLARRDGAQPQATQLAEAAAADQE